MKVRLRDIAEDLNVSVVTVSKVLRNQGDISAATRKRVLDRARELNYRPNWVARSLVSKRTFTIGLVVPDLMSTFFAEVATGIARVVRPHGLNVLISNSDEDADLEAEEIDSLISRQVDGLVIASSQTQIRPAVFEEIHKARIPFVLIDRELPGVESHFVGVDNVEIGRLATSHLIAMGCRRIAHIRGFQASVAEQRFEGYKAALAAHRLPADSSRIVQAGHGPQAGGDAMRELLSLDPRPDGVFCFNDPMAASAIAAICNAGLRVPGDIAVAGSGNLHYSSLLTVPLSTVDQNSAGIGETAANILLEAIGSKSPLEFRRIILPCRLIARGSTAR